MNNMRLEFVTDGQPEDNSMTRSKAKLEALIELNGLQAHASELRALLSTALQDAYNEGWEDCDTNE